MATVERKIPGGTRIACAKTFRSGVTLVELMVSALILAIVCVAWFQIIGIQSARKEARRREAVERLAGMMDAFMYQNRTAKSFAAPSSYKMELDASTGVIRFTQDNNTNTVYAVFGDDVSPVGYQLCIVSDPGWTYQGFNSDWGNGRKWLVGRLYDGNGAVGDVGRPFFSLPLYLGVK